MRALAGGGGRAGQSLEPGLLCFQLGGGGDEWDGKLAPGGGSVKSVRGGVPINDL
jgi:hypothetical protein